VNTDELESALMRAELRVLEIQTKLHRWETGLVERPLRWEPHGGCGKRLGETGRSKDRNRAPGRLHGLELDDPGFDSSVLSEFRTRLVEHELIGAALDVLLEKLAGLGLVRAGGRARTDATHVLARIRHLNRLELACRGS
jgi:hypothetical protein